MNPIEKLTALFERFPGIGPRQARRFVHYLLLQPEVARKELVHTIGALGSEARSCGRCYRWFVRSDKVQKLCGICANPKRDGSVLFVVEKDTDIESVERTGFKGLYFVLGGTIPLASEHSERHIRLKELVARTKEAGLGEIILGLSATSEGDHTRQILQEKLRASGKKTSSLGRGLSTGSELEYADPDTIAQALGNRH